MLNYKTQKMKKLTLSLLLFLCTNVNAQLAPGSPALNFTVPAYQPWLSTSGSSSNGSYNLYQYLDAGYTVFLDISATWCGPCWNYHNTEALDALYAEHGPLLPGHPGVNANSTNNVMVIWIEGDGATADATMLDGAGAIGNWTNPTGTHPVQFPMSNPNATLANQINSDYAVGYFPTLYKVCPNRTVYEVGQMNAAQLYATVGSCPSAGLTANFTASSISVCQGGAVTFTNQSTNSPTTYSWSFPGGTPATSTAANPVVTYSTPGTYSVTLTSSNATQTDTEVKTNYISVLGSGTALPLNEGFTAATFPAANWLLVNTNASSTWARNASVGNAPTAGNSMMFDNFTINDGDDDEVRIKPLNMSSLTSGQLTFDVAYAPYDATNFDGLQVLVSTNCGATFTSVYSKSNTTLATAPATTATFTPTAAQWRTETINLNAYAGQSNVVIAFRNLSGYGNRLFVDNINVTGAAAATSSFSASPSTACTGQSVTVTNSSSGATSWSWNFGAGATPATATGAGPHTVSYSSPGSKTLTLTINGSVSSTQNVTINSTATPTITAGGPTTFCSGNSVTLTSSATSGNTWSNGSTGQSITVSNAGTYTLTTTSNGCQSASTNTTVTVNPSPVISVTSSSSPINCGTNTGSILIGGSGIGNLSWSGSASGSQNNVSLPVTIPNLGSGSYNISFTSNSGCLSNQLSQGINDPSAPATPVISANGALTFCQGNSVTLTTSSPSGNVWSNGANGQSITVSASGTYSVVTTNASGCSSTSLGTVVTMIPTPVIAQGGSSNPTGCNLSNGSITVTGNGTGTLSWSGAATGSLPNATLPVTINNLADGAFTITFVNQGGCSSNSISQTLSDPSQPAAATISVSDNTPCAGDLVTLTSSQANNNTWSNGATSSAIEIQQSGTYSLTYTDANGCTSPATSIGITFNNNPSVSFGQVADLCVYNSAITLNQGLPAGGIYSGTGVASGQFDPATAGIGSTTLTYAYTDANGCSGSATTLVNVDDCLGLNEQTATILALYPNPTTGNFHVSIGDEQIYQISLFDVNGKLVFDHSPNESLNEIELSISSLPNGVYQLKLTTNNSVHIGRVVMSK